MAEIDHILWIKAKFNTITKEYKFNIKVYCTITFSNISNFVYNIPSLNPLSVKNIPVDLLTSAASFCTAGAGATTQSFELYVKNNLPVVGG